MSSPFPHENEPQIQPRNPFARPGPIPDSRLDGLFLERAPSLVARAESSTTSASLASATSCGPNDNSGACEKYYNSDGSSNTLPIVLGVVIPLGIALLVLIYLHRRHVRKLRKEDAEDKHKSLDFGLNESGQKPRRKKGQKVPEMTMAESKEIGSLRRGRGLSLDLGLHNPYILPPQLQHSRESLHSLSRSMNTGDDKYRATNFIPDDGSIRPPSSLRSPMDDSSSWTGSSSRRFKLDSKQNLLRNAQDTPSGAPASLSNETTETFPGSRKPWPPAGNTNFLGLAPPEPARDSFVSTTSSNGGVNALRASNNYLGQFISGGDLLARQEPKKEATAMVEEVKIDVPVAPPPPAVLKTDLRPPSIPPPLAPPKEMERTIAPSIILSEPETRQPRLPQLSFIDSNGDAQHNFQTTEVESNRSTYASPEPQPYVPSAEDMNQQARSTEARHDEDDYYDEYEAYASQEPQGYDGHQEYQDYDDYQEVLGYDPRRMTMGLRPLPPDDPTENPEQRANRIRSFYKEYFDESKPQNYGQQAQYYDSSEGYYDQYAEDGYYDEYYDPTYYPPRGMSQNGMYGRHRATVSSGSYQPGPRAFSSASGQYYGGRPRMPPKKKLPPPKALHILPTPSKLKEDTFLPIDFAPPQKYQNQRAGTPDSLRGGLRPYSPSIRPHLPLASSFDDLAVIPSPHQLRKSATFTALDFAPPRFRSNDSQSDAGSIRSNRSGVSAIHLHNIRTGAYRVSRIPKEVAGTRDELAAALKPQWDLNR